MAGSPVSLSDVTYLVALAWKIGRAFSAGKAGAPAEFREVERELEGLTASIALLADTLDSDHSILAKAESRAKKSLEQTIASCRAVRLYLLSCRLSITT